MTGEKVIRQNIENTNMAEFSLKDTLIGGGLLFGIGVFLKGFKGKKEIKVDSQDWGGDPDGQLAKALAKVREDAKLPKESLKIEKLPEPSPPYYEISVESSSKDNLGEYDFDGITLETELDSRYGLSRDYGEGGDEPLMTPEEAIEDYRGQISLTTHSLEPDWDEDTEEWHGAENTNIWRGTINFPNGNLREGGEFYTRAFGFTTDSESEAEQAIMNHILHTLDVYARERGDDGEFHHYWAESYDAESFEASTGDIEMDRKLLIEQMERFQDDPEMLKEIEMMVQMYGVEGALNNIEMLDIWFNQINSEEEEGEKRRYKNLLRMNKGLTKLLKKDPRYRSPFNAESSDQVASPCPCGCNGKIEYHDDRSYGCWECPRCGEDSDADMGEDCSYCVNMLDMGAESFGAETVWCDNCAEDLGEGDAQFGEDSDADMGEDCSNCVNMLDMGAESFGADEDCESCGESFEKGYTERCKNCDECEDCCKDNGETCSNPACELEECEEDVYWHEGDKPYCYNCGLVFKKAKYSAESKPEGMTISHFCDCNSKLAVINKKNKVILKCWDCSEYVILPKRHLSDSNKRQLILIEEGFQENEDNSKFEEKYPDGITSESIQKFESFGADEWCSNCGGMDCKKMPDGDWYCMNFLNNRETYDERYWGDNLVGDVLWDAETFNANVDTETKDYWYDNIKYSWEGYGLERYQNDRFSRSMKSCVKDWLADNPNELAYMVQKNHEINEESMDGDYEVPSPQMMKKEVAYLKSVFRKVADEMDKNGEWHRYSMIFLSHLITYWLDNPETFESETTGKKAESFEANSNKIILTDKYTHKKMALVGQTANGTPIWNKATSTGKIPKNARRYTTSLYGAGWYDRLQNGERHSLHKARPKRTEYKLMEEIYHNYTKWEYGPENLWEDGEASLSRVKAKLALSKREIKIAEKELGRKVSKAQAIQWAKKNTNFENYAETFDAESVVGKIMKKKKTKRQKKPRKTNRVKTMIELNPDVSITSSYHPDNPMVGHIEQKCSSDVCDEFVLTHDRMIGKRCLKCYYQNWEDLYDMGATDIPPPVDNSIPYEVRYRRRTPAEIADAEKRSIARQKQLNANRSKRYEEIYQEGLKTPLWSKNPKNILGLSWEDIQNEAEWNKQYAQILKDKKKMSEKGWRKKYGLDAETFDAETRKLKKDSCCCGATKKNPCECMYQGISPCSSTCPCALENKKKEQAKGHMDFDAESFSAESFLANEMPFKSFWLVAKKSSKSFPAGQVGELRVYENGERTIVLDSNLIIPFYDKDIAFAYLNKHFMVYPKRVDTSNSLIMGAEDDHDHDHDHENIDELIEKINRVTDFAITFIHDGGFGGEPKGIIVDEELGLRTEIVNYVEGSIDLRLVRDINTNELLSVRFALTGDPDETPILYLPLPEKLTTVPDEERATKEA